MAGWKAVLWGAIAAAGVGGVAGAARGQMVQVNQQPPVLDRWMYNFNQTPGVEQNASVFTSLGDALQANFDDHDGQFLLGFDTVGTVPAGLPVAHYRIVSVQVVARNSRNLGFRYDPTYDGFATFLPVTDPAHVDDADLGRPIEMYGCGYRNGWTLGTFDQAGPFCSPASAPTSCDYNSLPQRETRNVFAGEYDLAGQFVDVSNNISGATKFDPRPFAVGQAAVTPGDLVPLNTDFTFNIDLANAGVVRYLRECLAEGRVTLAITALAPATQQGGNPPRFYTRQAFAQTLDPVRTPASLTLRVCVGPPGDWNCSGAKTVQDIFDFLAEWFGGNADFNSSGATTVQDIFDFLAAWFS